MSWDDEKNRCEECGYFHIDTDEFFKKFGGSREDEWYKDLPNDNCELSI